MICQTDGAETYPSRSSYVDPSELYRMLYGVVMASDPDGQEEDAQMHLQMHLADTSAARGQWTLPSILALAL